MLSVEDHGSSDGLNVIDTRQSFGDQLANLPGRDRRSFVDLQLDQLPMGERLANRGQGWLRDPLFSEMMNRLQMVGEPLELSSLLGRERHQSPSEMPSCRHVSIMSLSNGTRFVSLTAS